MGFQFVPQMEQVLLFVVGQGAETLADGFQGIAGVLADRNTSPISFISRRASGFTPGLTVCLNSTHFC